MFIFSELQTEVKRSAVRNQAGTEFDTAVKNAINRAINQISREAKWRSLRRGPATITTVGAYTEGTGAVAVTEDSAAITVTGATFITDGVTIGRRIDVGGSSKKYRISSITGETTITLDQTYDGDDATDQSYSIYPQGEYNLPIQSDHQAYLWHEQYGTPTLMNYITEAESIGSGLWEDTTGTPTYYRMWGEDSVITQPRKASIVSVVSSSASDTTPVITIFGTVSGYPDSETVTVTGVTVANGSKSFTSVERVVASAAARVGRITVSANTAKDTIAVLPVGNTTREVKYSKIKIRPLPTVIFPLFVMYYKTPYMLVSDGDVHELGGAFDSAIINLATSIVRGENSQDEAKTYYALYTQDIKKLKNHYLDKIDWLPRLQPGAMTSRVGGGVHRNLSYGQMGTGGWFGPRT